MSKAIALTRKHATHGAEALRFLIVVSSAFALMVAGQALPAFS